MLTKLEISNFGSIGSKQTVDFTAPKTDAIDDSTVRLSDKTHANLVSCLVGSNASGKTTILKAISFLHWMLWQSYDAPDAELPFKTHKLLDGQPTTLIGHYTIGGIYHKYTIVIQDGVIIEEQLQRRGERLVALFKVARSPKGDTTLRLHKDIKEMVIPSERRRLTQRPRSLFLSGLLRTGYLPDILRSLVPPRVVTNIKLNASLPITASLAREVESAVRQNPELASLLVREASKVDLGISGLELNESGRLESRHQSDVDSGFTIPLEEESSGTQMYVYFISRIFDALQSGGLVLFDEVERGYHPYVLEQLLGLFTSADTNPGKARFIFSTHMYPILDHLKRSQIIITDKNANLETQVYRLTDVTDVRPSDDFSKKYIQGTYGGVPDINWLM